MSDNIKSINYKPNIFYELDKAPPNDYREYILNSENFVTADDLKNKCESTNVDIDFLIQKTEEELKGYEGFNDYKPPAVKKYYCKDYINEDEEENIKVFETKLYDIDGNMAIDYYKRLLTLKAETDSDLEAVAELMRFESRSLVEYIRNITAKYDMNEDYLEQVYRQDVIDDSRAKVEMLNTILSELQNNKKDLKKDFKKAVSEGNSENARQIQFEMEDIKAETKRVKNSLGYTASQSYGLYKKLAATESFVQQIGYMIIASPYDNLDGTVCCLLKALLKQAGFDDDLNKVEARLNSLNLEELRNAVDTIRGLLALSYNKTSEILAQVEIRLMDILTSPLKATLGKVISVLRDLELSAFRNVYKLFDSVTGDFDNPDNVLDCIYLEELMDFVFDKMDEVFEDIEAHILDLYRAVNQQIDLYDADAIKLFEKAKTKQVYDLLTKFSKVLKTVDDFSAKQGMEQWIEGFLLENGYGTYYDNKAGKYKNINLGGCISPMDYDGSYTSFVPDTPFDIPKINFAKNDEYKEWLKNGEEITFACSTENKINKDLETQKRVLDKVNSDIGSVSEDTLELASKYIEDNDLNY